MGCGTVKIRSRRFNPCRPHLNVKQTRKRHRELVVKKLRGTGLTDDEQKELVEIETAIREAVMKEFPPLGDAEQNPNQTGH